ncbi:B-cell receptor CD22 isoform X2 [Kryptolebias marmoratus]|uniref:B-cell receptor CD22 isoform X2 n=1 Tax=Kryptolebias marmoratus TaxID=37003 RepID=UPI0007F8A38C|nr:B-cell receptor CD22 isoform X2 [Kryptolebias marmoratus]
MTPGEAGGSEGQEYKMWCLEDSRCITQRYVFHSAGIFPDPSYQKRVQYLGEPGTKNCSLRISELRQSDSGTYVFYLITDHPTEKMPAQRGVQLLVAESPGAVAVSAGPSRVLSEGAALRLACCSPAARSQASFRWYKSTGTTLIHAGQVWNTSEVTSRDSGSYFCQMQDGDKVQNSTMLVVDVQYPPRNLAVSVGPAGGPTYEVPATLTCSSDANPPVHTYTWYQATACAPTADRSSHQGRRTSAAPTGRGSTLSSANLTTEEPGQHCCVAQNEHGFQISNVTLRASRATTPSDSSQSKVVLIGVTAGILVVILALVAFLVTRKQKTTRNQSYILTETTATDA